MQQAQDAILLGVPKYLLCNRLQIPRFQWDGLRDGVWLGGGSTDGGMVGGLCRLPKVDGH